MSADLRRRAAFRAILRAFKPGAPGFGRRMAAIPRLVWATVRGEYDGGLRLLTMAAASLYVVSPLDALPEAFLLAFGLIDDAVVVAWLVGALLSETERFLEWEKAKGRGPSVIRAHVVQR
jgi:uncharacterized membrane protein YkvA (DUF1232 family)